MTETPGGPSVTLLIRLEALNRAWLSGGVVERDAFQTLLDEARVQGDLQVELRVQGDMGWFLRERQGDAAALAFFREAHAYALQHPHDVRMARVLNALASLKRRTPAQDEALRDLLDAQAYARNSGDTEAQFLILNNLAGFHHQARAYGEALALHQEALVLAQQLGSASRACISLVNQMELLNALGRHQEVLDLLEPFQDLMARLPIPEEFLSPLSLAQSDAHLALGQPEQALDWAQRGLEIVQKSQQRNLTLNALTAVARALLALDRPAQALPSLQQALKLAQEHPAEGVLLPLYEQLALSYHALNQPEQAFQYAMTHASLLRERYDQALLDRTHALTATARLRELELEIQQSRLENAELNRLNEALQRTQEALQHTATHDTLTGLLRRDAFHVQVQQVLKNLTQGEQAALLFIDLDDFKSVNDLHGHAMGDELLRHIAGSLKRLLGDRGLISRMGSDEFMVFLPPPAPLADTESLVAEVLNVVRTPVQLRGRLLDSTASVGLAFAPQDGLEADTLRRNADIAMYHVKREGGNARQRFTAQMQQAHDERLRLERALTHALTRQELHVHYQGRFAVPGRKLRGFEALLRWHSPEHGWVDPASFIPLAEQSGFIAQMDAWVLREACRQAVDWNFPQRQLSMSVNVSGRRFEQPHFVQDVRNILLDTGLPGPNLVLELTEGMVLSDLNTAREHFRELRELGVLLALDDFGKGYSSLSLLKTLPFNHLKIDRLFLQSLNLDTLLDTPDGILLESMLHLAHRLHMQVTVEGVELEQQLQALFSLGCDEVQGFLLARPQSARQASALIEN